LKQFFSARPAGFVSVSPMPSKRISRLLKILSGAAANAEEEIFVLENRLERLVHFWALAVRQFIQHRCLVRASALSYATLIALIPLLAVALSITSSLLKTQDEEKFQYAVEKMVASITPPAALATNGVAAELDLFADLAVEEMPPAGAGAPAPSEAVVTISAQKEIASKIWGFVQQTRSGALGATGVVVLIFLAVSLLGRIEESFNDIWGVTRGRRWLTRIPLYFTTIVLGPLLLLAALSLLGGGHFQSARAFITQMPLIGNLVFQLLPVAVSWLAFTLVYLLLPNTRVNFSAAAVGGAVAGALWFLNNVCGFLFVSRVVTNSKIYGSLGLVPVLMIGLYFSWLFLLFGAQIAYAFQNRAVYLQDRLADNVNQRGREFVALRLMTRIGLRFHTGAPPATVSRLSSELGIPGRLTRSILRVLAHNGLVTEVAGPEPAFAPARPLDTISAHDILYALRTGTSAGQNLPIAGAPELAEIYGEFAAIEQAERQAAATISLLALSRRLASHAAALPAPVTLAAGKHLAPAPVMSEPAPENPAPVSSAAEPPAAAPAVEATQPVAPPAAETDQTSAPPAVPPAPRREVVRPAEDAEFPL
jgi:membrane protein